MVVQMSSTLLIVEKPQDAYNQHPVKWPETWMKFLQATAHLRGQPTDVAVLADNVFWFPPSADGQLLAGTLAKAHQFGLPTVTLVLPDRPSWERYDPNQSA